MAYDAVQSKRLRVARERGTPSLMKGAEVESLRARLRGFREHGMPLEEMAAQSGVTFTGVSEVINRENNTIRRSTYQKLVRVRFAEGAGPGAQVPPLGTVRRIRALWADGWSLAYLAPELGMTRRNLQTLMNEPRGYVFAETARRVRGLYDKLDGTGPEGLVGLREVRYARTFAKKRGYPPRSCWDVDTIDDPAAIPEWTGRCGTVFGWRIHDSQEIPICQPCADARGASDAVLSGEKLRLARVRRGLSQGQLAAEAGVKVDQYRSWETGRSKPRYQRDLDLVLAALDVTYDEVVE